MGLMRKWKWLIVLVIAMSVGKVGFHYWPPLGDEHTLGLLAIIFGLYGTGYAAARLDELVGDSKVRIRIQLDRWRPRIEVTRLTPKEQ